MLLIKVYAPLVVYGTEGRLVETKEQSVLLAHMKHLEHPSQHPSEVNRAMARRLSKTNEEQRHMWTMFGFLLFMATLAFWFWLRIKKVGFK